MEEYKKNCKMCGREVVYKSYPSYHNACVKERPCMSCSHKGFDGEKNCNYKHGLTHTKSYRLWAGIKNRCFNKKTWAYEYYGNRGITMYKDWIDDVVSFSNYILSLENYGVKGYTLDRINNDGNYEPDNLRWADKKTQRQNQRASLYKQPRNVDNGRFVSKNK